MSKLKTPPFFRVILFDKTWQKIQHRGLRRYLEAMFLGENLFLKAIITALIAILVLGLGFGLRDYFVNMDPSPVVINTGIAYSSLAGVGAKDPAAIYAIEAIPIIVAFLAFILIPKWYAAAGFTMMFFGGLVNIIDRSVPKTFWSDNYGPPLPHRVTFKDGVADYFHGIHSIFNIADVFVIMGVCLGILGIIVWIGISLAKEPKDAKKVPPPHPNN